MMVIRWYKNISQKFKDILFDDDKVEDVLDDKNKGAHIGFQQYKTREVLRIICTQMYHIG